MNALQKVQIRDCVALSKGKPPVQQPYYGTDSVWYLTPEYLRGADTCERVKPSPRTVYINDGDTIVLWDGSNAGEVFYGREGTLASTMSHAAPDDRFQPEYFFYALKRWQSFLKGQTAGSGIPHVDKDVLGGLELIEFNDGEQSKIAEVLSTVDRAIAQTEALIAKQQRIKTGLMQDLLTRGIDEAGNLRSEATHAFKDSPLGRIPVEWRAGLFSSVFIRRPQNGIYKPESEYCDNGIPIVRIDGFSGGDVIYNQTLRRLRLKPSELSVFGLQRGDILINRVNTLELVAKSALVGNLVEPTVFESNMMRLRLDPTYLLPGFGILVLTMAYAKRHFLTSAKPAVAQASINQGDVGSLAIAFPSIREQALITECVNMQTAILQVESRRREKLRSLKTGLMQDLLTGKVRVTPLLEQTKATA